jgi:hypothetical protein
MKNLRITEDCLVGGQHQAAGTILKNVENRTAAELLISGRAVLADEVVEHRDPVAETRDPKPKRKAAK